jgi:hypothetical protein
MSSYIPKYLYQVLRINQNWYHFGLVAELYEFFQMQVLKPEVNVEAKLCLCLFAVKLKVPLQALSISLEHGTNSFGLHEFNEISLEIVLYVPLISSCNQHSFSLPSDCLLRSLLLHLLVFFFCDERPLLFL